MNLHAIIIAMVGILSGAVLIFTGAINLKAAHMSDDDQTAARQRNLSIPVILTGGLFVVFAVLVFTGVIQL